MYLAPLNYDRFFKKVFSDLEISKKFLEDALSVSISEIKLLPSKHKITDAARSVDFDFRCKINERFVIIEMQQWFKPDIIQRFHLYHSLNTALQLEDLPNKVILTMDNTIQEVKNYSQLKPVITIIWLVHENLSETDDYLSFVPTSESVVNFIRNHSLWGRNDMQELQEERKRLLKKIDNNTKGLLWMQENKEIFFFQKNIVKNKNNAGYLHWFAFAEKTLKKDNTKEDFVDYEDDAIFRKMIKRLNASTKNKQDMSYIDDYETRQAKVQQFIDSISKEAIMDKEMELKNERQEKEEALAKEKETRILSAQTLLEYNVPIEKIMQTTGLSREEIENLSKK
jgi:hypothetical protein